MDHGPPGLGSDTAGVAEYEFSESFDLIWCRMDLNRTELLDSNSFTVNKYCKQIVPRTFKANLSSNPFLNWLIHIVCLSHVYIMEWPF